MHVIQVHIGQEVPGEECVGVFLPEHAALDFQLLEPERLGQGDGSGLSNLISGGNLTQFADNPSSLATPAALEQGKSLVSSIFGNADLTHMVSTVAEKVGVSSSIVNSILPIAATLLGGLLSKSTSAGSSLTDAVDQVASAGHTGILDTVKNLAAKVFG